MGHQSGDSGSIFWPYYHKQFNSFFGLSTISNSKYVYYSVKILQLKKHCSYFLYFESFRCTKKRMVNLVTSRKLLLKSTTKEIAILITSLLRRLLPVNVVNRRMVDDARVPVTREGQKIRNERRALHLQVNLLMTCSGKRKHNQPSIGYP